MLLSLLTGPLLIFTCEIHTPLFFRPIPVSKPSYFLLLRFVSFRHRPKFLDITINRMVNLCKLSDHQIVLYIHYRGSLVS